MKSLSLFILSFYLLALQSEKTSTVSPDVLLGTWQLDMTPQDPNDNNFAKMRIDWVDKNSMKGEFYRDGVKIKDGQINTLSGVVYGALVSGDNSGSYNTSFYYKEGKLYGSTHAIERNFLSVWTAVKVEENKK